MVWCKLHQNIIKNNTSWSFSFLNKTYNTYLMHCWKLISKNFFILDYDMAIKIVSGLFNDKRFEKLCYSFRLPTRKSQLFKRMPLARMTRYFVKGLSCFSNLTFFWNACEFWSMVRRGKLRSIIKWYEKRDGLKTLFSARFFSQYNRASLEFQGHVSADRKSF